jgi:hypothetical protein
MPKNGPVTITYSGTVARAARARRIATEMAGDKRRVVALQDGSALIVNYPGFDTSVWKAKRSRKR